MSCAAELPPNHAAIKIGPVLPLLRQVRLEAGLRQTDVAKRLGKPQSFVSNYESGERRLDLLELQMLCEVLGIAVLDFVGRFQGGVAEK